MRAILFFAMIAMASPAGGQISNPPVVTLPPNVATTTTVDAAIAAATPDACPIQPSDTLTGSVGTAAKCMPRRDATRPTVIQAKNTVTASDSTWAVTFDAAFPTVPIYVDARVYGATQPFLCTVTTATATGASGRCYQLVATTLPTAATALLGLVVSPVTSAAGNLSVRVVARQ